MRKLRVALVAAGVACSAAVVVAIGTGSASAADTELADGRLLTVEGVPGDLLVDPLHKHVLVSDPFGGKLIVTDYRGAVVSTRTGLPGVSGLTLSADAKTLYAAVADAHAIVSFDAATVTEQVRYSVDPKIFPRTVATMGRQIWFGYDGDAAGSWAGNFGVLEPADRVLRVHDPQSDGTSFTGSPALLTSPTVPGRLIVAEASTQMNANGNLATYTIAADGTEQHQGTARFTDDFLRGAVVTADGAGLIGWKNCRLWKSAVATPHLRTPAYAETCETANSVDAGPDGRVAIGWNNFDIGTDVSIYPRGSETAAQKFVLPSTQADRGPDNVDLVAWQPDGPRLFVLSHNSEHEYRLWVANDPDPRPTATTPAPTTPAPQPKPTSTTRVPVSLTVGGQGTVSKYGSTVNLTARIGDPGLVVEIWADPWGGDLPMRLVTRAKSNSAGIVSVPVKMTRNTTVSAKFTGDAARLPKEVKATLYTEVSAKIAVTRHYKTTKPAAITYAYFRKSVSPYFATTMTAYPGRKAQFVVEMWVTDRWRPARGFSPKTTPLDKAGKSYTTLGGSHPTGQIYRARAFYSDGVNGNDNVNYMTSSAPIYFLFTN
ncbi:hypothetical protein Aab01nite_58490 [Paractinoplanes abujensis]|uniref:Uncharacterized protein n=1 Tax=Paractinoplanes abujensis TaxID=882441 RepID=A0A7W7G6S1_9ACTN|nr:hypothetical protein [Actinoplanes abujensis]MBB4696266.1 hypothetical protein [Actinoplanes abujensis]GID22259.1 hypothetical protein Aab01nite_58490 [Actinoplanes abujensis]